MPAVAREKKEAKDAKAGRSVSVVAITHAFQDMKRYRRGDELTITLGEGEMMPAWCIAESDAPRTRDGKVDLAALPLFFSANART